MCGEDLLCFFPLHSHSQRCSVYYIRIFAALGLYPLRKLPWKNNREKKSKTRALDTFNYLLCLINDHSEVFINFNMKKNMIG